MLNLCTVQFGKARKTTSYTHDVIITNMIQKQVYRMLSCIFTTAIVQYYNNIPKVKLIITINQKKIIINTDIFIFQIPWLFWRIGLFLHVCSNFFDKYIYLPHLCFDWNCIHVRKLRSGMFSSPATYQKINFQVEINHRYYSKQVCIF